MDLGVRMCKLCVRRSTVGPSQGREPPTVLGVSEVHGGVQGRVPSGELLRSWEQSRKALSFGMTDTTLRQRLDDLLARWKQEADVLRTRAAYADDHSSAGMEKLAAQIELAMSDLQGAMGPDPS